MTQGHGSGNTSAYPHIAPMIREIKRLGHTKSLYLLCRLKQSARKYGKCRASTIEVIASTLFFNH
jgi:hypothetical protein